MSARGRKRVVLDLTPAEATIIFSAIEFASSGDETNPGLYQRVLDRLAEVAAPRDPG